LPSTIFLLITLFVGISQSFGMIALITNGGPGASTTTLSFYMYQTSFQFYRFGYASAVGLVTFLGIFVLMLAMWRAQRGRALHDCHRAPRPHQHDSPRLRATRSLQPRCSRCPPPSAQAKATLGLGPPAVVARPGVPAPLRLDDLHVPETRCGRLPGPHAVDPRGPPLGELHRSAVRGELDPARLRQLRVRGPAARHRGAGDRDAGRVRLRQASLPRPQHRLHRLPGDVPDPGAAAAGASVRVLPEPGPLRHPVGADPARDVHGAGDVPDAAVLREPARRVRGGGPHRRGERTTDLPAHLSAERDAYDQRAGDPDLRVVVERLRDAAGVHLQPGVVHAAPGTHELHRRDRGDGPWGVDGRRR